MMIHHLFFLKELTFLKELKKIWFYQNLYQGLSSIYIYNHRQDNLLATDIFLLNSQQKVFPSDQLFQLANHKELINSNSFLYLFWNQSSSIFKQKTLGINRFQQKFLKIFCLQFNSSN